MPRPPILETLDWKAIAAKGVAPDEWFARAEEPARREQMEQARADPRLTAQERAYVAGLAKPVHVVAIAEDWCGDVVRHVPVLLWLADASGGKVDVRFITREERKDVFVRYLTNGGEAIPKFVFLSSDYVECGNWGALPEAAKLLIARGKAAGNVGAAREKIKKLYEADEGRREVVRELLALIDIAATESV